MSERLFFSVPLTRKCQLDLIRLQALLKDDLQGPARVVPATNFHLTLAFLGQVTQPQKQALLQRWKSLPVPNVELTLDKLAYWPRAKVLCLNATEIPTDLMQLATLLRRDSADQGLYKSKQGFRPHVTLFRGVTNPGELPEAMEPISMPVQQVELLRSRYGGSGVQYDCLAQWY